MDSKDMWLIALTIAVAALVGLGYNADTSSKARLSALEGEISSLRTQMEEVTSKVTLHEEVGPMTDSDREAFREYD